jgi:hypothetical protein
MNRSRLLSSLLALARPVRAVRRHRDQRPEGRIGPELRQRRAINVFAAVVTKIRFTLCLGGRAHRRVGRGRSRPGGTRRGPSCGGEAGDPRWIGWSNVSSRRMTRSSWSLRPGTRRWRTMVGLARFASRPVSTVVGRRSACKASVRAQHLSQVRWTQLGRSTGAVSVTCEADLFGDGHAGIVAACCQPPAARQTYPPPGRFLFTDG